MATNLAISLGHSDKHPVKLEPMKMLKYMLLLLFLFQ